MRRSASYGSLLLMLLGVGILAAVIAGVGPGRTLRALRDIDPFLLLLGGGLLLGVWGLRILRWYLLLRAMGRPVAIAGLVTSYFLGAVAASVTPAQLGALGASGMVGRAGGVGAPEGASAIALDRAVELAFLAAGAALSAAYLRAQGLTSEWIGHVVLSIVVVLAVLALALIGAVQGWAGLTKLATAAARVTAHRKRLMRVSGVFAKAAAEWLPRLHTSGARIRSRRGTWIVLLCLVGLTTLTQGTTYSCLAMSAMGGPWLGVLACSLLAFAAGNASGMPGGVGVGGATFVAAASAAGYNGAEAAAGALVASALPVALMWTAAAVSLGARLTLAGRMSPREGGCGPKGRAESETLRAGTRAERA